MTIFHCKNQVATFNKKSNELKAKAIETGMQIVKEWKDGQFDCFIAQHSQAKIKDCTALFVECGAHAHHVNPSVWYSFAGTGRIEENTYVQR
jgi:hypothetical protein